jgi:hypothetical protein
MSVEITKTINPLQFILGNILRNNLVLINLKTEAIPEGTPLADCTDYFNRTIPAGTSYLLFNQIEGSLMECAASNFSMQGMEVFNIVDGGESPGAIAQTRRMAATNKLF